MKRKKLLISLGAMALLNLYTLCPKESSANDVTRDSISRSTNMVVSPKDDRGRIEESNSPLEVKDDKLSDNTISSSSLSQKDEHSVKSSVQDSNVRSVDDGENQTKQELPFSGYAEGSKYILTGYTGDSSEIEIPSIVEGKDVILKQHFLTSLPENLTRLVFKDTGGKRSELQNNDLTSVFQRYKNLQVVDFSGLNMDKVFKMYETFAGDLKLQSVKFGNNKLSEVKNVGGAFDGCKALTTVEGQLNLKSVTNFDAFFKDCHSLNSVDTSLWGMNSATTLSQLFSNCYSLEYIDTSKWDTSNVNSLFASFQNCSKLNNIDVTNWNVSQVTDASYAFTSTRGITKLDMTNWHFPDNVDLKRWMYCANLWKVRRLILTNDQNILKYDYNYDWCLPMGPYIHTEGGTLNDVNKVPESTGEYTYFNSPAIKPDDPKLTQFKQTLKEFLNTNIPTRFGYAFNNWSNNMISVDDASTYEDLFDTVYTAHWVSANYNTSEDNNKFDVLDQSLAFAYLPKEFVTGSTSILSQGKQEIPLEKKQSFNIGIKDRTRNHKLWYVTAQLKWNNPVFNNVYIQTENNLGIVKENISTGSGNYDPSTQLVSQDAGVRGQSSIKIESSHANPIIVSNSLLDKNAVYDYDLGNAKLVIPKTENIPVGSYQGLVEWNLVSAP